MPIAMDVASLGGTATQDFDLKMLVIAGWAGRDTEAQEHHIRELEALGVARPAATPTYYRASASRVTTNGVIEATGTGSSGEVEPVIFAHGGTLYVGVGSDHTDRKVETYSVTVSKQMCDKPVAATVWPFEEVADHWDELILRSHIVENGARVLYQEGPVSALLDPRETIAGYCENGVLPDGTALFCGTVPAIGGIRSAGLFAAELVDPVRDRRIGFEYEIRSLPVAG